MRQAVVISANSERASVISEVLSELGFDGIDISSGENAAVNFFSNNYELAVLLTPLEHEFGLDLTASLAEDSTTAFILLVNAQQVDEVKRKLSTTGVYILPKNVSKQTLLGCASVALQARLTICRLMGENTGLEKKLDDIKLIDRAKCVLIQYLRISEHQAHRHIQKQAMDQRVSQARIAQDILRTYEL